MSESLEAMIENMKRLGEVAIHSYKDGTWTCTLEFYSPLDGVELKAKSGFKNKTMLEAVLACQQRIEAIRITAGSIQTGARR